MNCNTDRWVDNNITKAAGLDGDGSYKHGFDAGRRYERPGLSANGTQPSVDYQTTSTRGSTSTTLGTTGIFTRCTATPKQ
jgi:hypothetical protein